MNTIRSYKALAIVSNVDQGELIKRLIKENKELQILKEILTTKYDGLVEIYDFLEDQQMMTEQPSDANGIYDINLDDGSGDYDDAIYIHNLLLPLSDLLDQLVVVVAVPAISS